MFLFLFFLNDVGLQYSHYWQYPVCLGSLGPGDSCWCLFGMLQLRDTPTSSGSFKFFVWHLFLLLSTTTCFCEVPQFSVTLPSLLVEMTRLRAAPLVIIFWSCLSVFVNPAPFLTGHRTVPRRALNTHLRCQRFNTERKNEPLVVKQQIRTPSHASLDHSI